MSCFSVQVDLSWGRIRSEQAESRLKYPSLLEAMVRRIPHSARRKVRELEPMQKESILAVFIAERRSFPEVSCRCHVDTIESQTIPVTDRFPWHVRPLSSRGGVAMPCNRAAITRHRALPRNGYDIHFLMKTCPRRVYSPIGEPVLRDPCLRRRKRLPDILDQIPYTAREPRDHKPPVFRIARSIHVWNLRRDPL